MLFNIILFVIVAVALLFSLVLHEVSHGLVAHWCGDETAKNRGRLSLNPLKHLDPIGTAFLLIAGFGYAKPVPVNPYNFKHFRRGCIFVSIAGITMNIIISLLSGCFYGLFMALSVKFSNEICLFLALFFMYLCTINCYLCFFNLLPFFPLDGFNLIQALCKRDNGFIRFMRKYGSYILLALIIVSFVVSRANVPIWFSPLHVYRTYTADLLSGLFMRLGELIFGGI